MNGKTMKTLTNKNIEILQFTNLSRSCKISHFISTRKGGISQGTYASLNVGEYCEDDPIAVQTNRQRLCNLLQIQPEKLFAPFQTHQSEIAVLNNSFLALSHKQQQEYLHGMDALITNIPDIFIAVTTADCVPILLYDPEKEIVAAIHAGWRSSAQEIAIKTVNKMKDLFACKPQSILAGIGPSISQEVFEVGDEVYEAFTTTCIHPVQYAFRNKQTEKFHLDLWEANRLQLIEAGIHPDHIEVAGICTYSTPDLFFSARKEGVKSGRMLSGIGLKKQLYNP